MQMTFHEKCSVQISNYPIIIAFAGAVCGNKVASTTWRVERPPLQMSISEPISGQIIEIIICQSKLRELPIRKHKSGESKGVSADRSLSQISQSCAVPRRVVLD